MGFWRGPRTPRRCQGSPVVTGLGQQCPACPSAQRVRPCMGHSQEAGRCPGQWGQGG